MYRPLKLNNTSPVSLKEMSDSEIEVNIINPILAAFAVDHNGTGALRSSTFGGPAIGTWSDRNRTYDIGSHGFPGVDNFTTTTYSVFQNLSRTNEGNMVRPLCFKYLYTRVGSITGGTSTINLTNTTGLQLGMDVHGPGVPSKTLITNIVQNTSVTINNTLTASGSGIAFGFRKALVQMSDEDLDMYIFGPALTKMTNMGLGSYYLSTSAPTSPSGSTWSGRFSFVDNSKPSSTATKTMWRMVGLSTPGISDRPLKYTEGNVNVLGDEGIRPMTDDDITSLVARFKNRIVDTGIGTYALQQFAPSTGTWAQVGESISDLLNVMSNETYTSTFVGFYRADYRRNYFGDYVGVYAGYPWVGVYASQRTETFGKKINTFTGQAYGGVYTLFYTGVYTGGYMRYRSAQIANAYTAYFTGATVSSSRTAVETDALWVRRS